VTSLLEIPDVAGTEPNPPSVTRACRMGPAGEGVSGWARSHTLTQLAQGAVMDTEVTGHFSRGFAGFDHHRHGPGPKLWLNFRRCSATDVILSDQERLSKILAVLREAGVVARARAGRHVVYRLTARGEQLTALLTD
jgi:hypothetical protein